MDTDLQCNSKMSSVYTFYFCTVFSCFMQLAKEVIDYSQLLAVLKELATFVRKVDGILKCNMKDLDDLFSK